MRNRGGCVELLRVRPHDHIGWVFSGTESFAALAKGFLIEGAERGEQLMYVVEDPDSEPLQDLGPLLDLGSLQIRSIADVYGKDGMVDAAVQRATFAAALADALSHGYRGIRVAADNSPLVTDPKRLEAWIRWEMVADRFMSENAVTGLCAFDRERVNVNALRHLATLHPLSSADEPAPQFLLFSEDGHLRLEGEVDGFAVEHVRLALKQLPAKTDVVVDLSKTSFVTKGTMLMVCELVDDGIGVLVRGASAGTRQLGETVGLPARCFAGADRPVHGRAP